MSAPVADSRPGQGWDDAVRLWEATDPPEGCKVEIVDEIVVVSLPPSDDHNDIAETVQRRLCSVIPENWGIYQRLAVALPYRCGMYVPDLLVVCRDVLGGGNFIPAGEAALVVEITSKLNANHDRVEKVAGYAQAGVPLYLLIDRWAPGGPTVTLYGEPEGGVYRTLHTDAFGAAVQLPEPFGVLIETADFPRG